MASSCQPSSTVRTATSRAIGGNYAQGNAAAIVVPTAEDEISRSPRSSDTRSRIPVSPNPPLSAVAGLKPWPSSATQTWIAQALSSTAILTAPAPACRIALVSASWTIR